MSIEWPSWLRLVSNIKTYGDARGVWKWCPRVVPESPGHGVPRVRAKQNSARGSGPSRATFRGNRPTSSWYSVRHFISTCVAHTIGVALPQPPLAREDRSQKSIGTIANATFGRKARSREERAARNRSRELETKKKNAKKNFLCLTGSQHQRC